MSPANFRLPLLTHLRVWSSTHRSAACATVPEITAIACQQLLAQTPDQVVLVDVRNPHEHAREHLPGAHLVPLTEIRTGSGIERIRTLLANRQTQLAFAQGTPPVQPLIPLIVYCTAGIRSAQALVHLQQAGIEGRNLSGGLRAWYQTVGAIRPATMRQPAIMRQPATMRAMRAFQSPLRQSRGWLVASTLLVVGGLGWASYKAVQNPDRLRPLLQAGVPLQVLSGTPVLGEAIQAATLPQVSVQQLQQALNQPGPSQPILLVDVRTPQEYQDNHIPGAVLVPLSDIQSAASLDRLRTLAPGRQLVAYCTTGLRSGQALVRLQRAGLAGTQLKGGIVAWIDQKYPTEPLP